MADDLGNMDCVIAVLDIDNVDKMVEVNSKNKTMGVNNKD